jgi:enoyl-CoA hydratase/carnithine racemase
MRDAGAIAALMDREGEFFTQQLLSAEAREAFSAFLERRPPNFAAVG